MYFKVLPDNPEICMQVYDPEVPECQSYANSPVNGFKELPTDTCR